MSKLVKPKNTIGIAVNNILLFNEIILVTNLLGSNKIDYIILKGPKMIRLYKNIGIRETADIDILIKKKDILKTEKLLLSLGYNYDNELHSRFYQSLLGYHYQYRKNNYLIEVHFDLFPPLAPIVKSVLDPWKFTGTLKIFNSKITILQEDFLFLYISINFLFPNFLRSSRKFLNDLKHLAKNRDWDRIYSLVNDSKSFFYMYYSCYYANKLVNADIPMLFLKRVKKNLSLSEQYLIGHFDERFLKKTRSVPFPKKVLLYILFNLVWRIRV